MNWPGLAFRFVYALLCTLALLGWWFFGWQQALGVAVGFLLAVATFTAQEMRDSGFDPFAWRAPRRNPQ
jgi:hypothetical protein